jgi:hypothetical protein
VVPRRDAIGIFRRIAEIGLRNRDSQEIGDWSLNHSQLGTLPSGSIDHIATSVASHPLGYAALRPLLLFEDLPARDQWLEAINADIQEADWQTLADAVSKVLDHQSQESTDVRWLTLLFKMGLGVVHFPFELKERAEEIIAYPDRGDMHIVRPFIRAAEMSFASMSQPESGWAKVFWQECLKKTTCNPSSLPARPEPLYDRRVLIRQLQNVYGQLLDHWFETLDTTAVDPKHKGSEEQSTSNARPRTIHCGRSLEHSELVGRS